jgi:FtsP/CotA-like multicopper oxidase with cupredoxin domain
MGSCFPATLLFDFPHDFSKLPKTAFDECIPSQGPTEVIEVDLAHRWVSINIINTASINTLTVSIDEHPMWIYAADGRHIQPVMVHAISVPNGNRFSALVKLDKPPRDYTIRVANQVANQVISGFATLSYKGSRHNTKSTPYINYVGQNVTADVIFFDETKIVPFPPIAPAPTADATYFLHIKHFGTAWKWTLSGKESFGLNIETETPLLFDPSSAEARNPNLTITTKMGQWVDLVVQVATPGQPAHPLHKHSNKAFIIGAGPGLFNWSTTAEAIKSVPQFFNLKTPPLRDGFTTIPAITELTWMVIRYQVVNPGAFMFHCRKSRCAGRR